MMDHSRRGNRRVTKLSRRDAVFGMAGAVALGHSRAIAAPGGRTGNQSRTTAADVTEIEFWHGFAAHEIDALQAILDERFAPGHPDVKVKAVGGVTPEKALAAISGGNPPDVIMLPGPEAIGTWAKNGVIQELDDRIKASGLDVSVYVDAGLQQCTFQDKVFALPFMNFNTGLYWNKSIFKDAGLDPEKGPASLDDLRSMAKALTVEDNGRIRQIGVLPSFGLVEMVWRFGGDWYDAASNAVTADRPENLDALNFERELVDLVGGVDKFKRFQGSFATGGGAADNPFYQGKIGVMMDGCWHVEFIEKYASGLDYGVAPMPALEGVKNGSDINRLGTNPIAIPAGAKNVDAAWELMSFLSTDVETARKFASVIANIPHLKAATDGFTDNERLQVFVDLSLTEGARQFPVLAITEQYTEAIATLESGVLTGTTEAEPGLKQLQSDMQTALESA